MARQEVAYFCHFRSEEPQDQSAQHWSELTNLLELFKDMLEEPRVMPSGRTTDHHITLHEGVQPVNVHPYRCLHFQKNEIEWLMAEMLKQCLVRHSVCPFSSLVLLVRKKDGVGDSGSTTTRLMPSRSRIASLS